MRIFHQYATLMPKIPRTLSKRMNRSLIYAVLVAILLNLAGCSNDFWCWPMCDSDTSSGTIDNEVDAGTSSTDSTADDAAEVVSQEDTSSTRIVLAGPNGGETFELIGSSQPLRIRWTVEGEFPILVDLYKSGAIFLRIEQNPNTSTGTTWTPPASLPPGDDYRVKVFSALDHSVSDFSNGNFTLSISD